MRRKHYLALVILIALVSACADDNDGVSSPPTLTTSPADRQWLHHDEFAATPGLRAQPDHTVILHLESSGGRLETVRSTIPYFFAETTTFNFCVPEDDPYLLAFTLVREDLPDEVVSVARGEPCETRTIEAGRYRLHVEHDATNVPADGVTAFVHVPRRRGTARTSAVLDGLSAQPEEAGLQAQEPFQTSAAPGSFSAPCDPDPLANPLYTIATSISASDRLYVSPIIYGKNRTQKLTAETEGFLTLGWNICPDGDGNVTITNTPVEESYGTDYVAYWFSPGPPSADTSFDNYDYSATSTKPPAPPTRFRLTDYGNFQFTLAANFGGTFYPVVLGSDNILHWAPPGTTPTMLTTVVKFYFATYLPSTPLSLGEAALFQVNCNYDNDKYDTSVVLYDIPDLDKLGTLASAGTLKATKSVKVGPQTTLALYGDVNYGGTEQPLFTDTPCLSSTPSSLKVEPTRDYIIATNACLNCNLSGVDLSNLDLSYGNFGGSVFDGADLTHTSFRQANVENAQFSSWSTSTLLKGTDFVGARLGCAQFGNSDLRETRFWEAGGSDPIITRDFSCRLGLAYAHLDGDTFPHADWRYLALQNAIFSDVSGTTLSTISNPLDLSNALFPNAEGLTGVVLEGATLSGANFNGVDLTGADLASVVATEANPASFNGATLTNVTLKNASLPKSFFRGAAMNPVNLYGADLSGAWLQDDGSGYRPTSLVGSYMLNTNLNKANLTNAILDGVSWYNKASDKPIATGAGAVLTGASFILADLPGLDLTGAYLYGATLTNTQLIGANLTGAHLEPGGNRSSLSLANLRGANLTGTNLSSADMYDAGIAPLPDSEVFIEVLKDPDRYQMPAQYEYLAVDRPATVLGSDTITTTATTCPDGMFGPCGPIDSARWVAPAGPKEPTDCHPSEYDSEGNVIAITCSSDRHPVDG